MIWMMSPATLPAMVAVLAGIRVLRDVAREVARSRGR